MVQLSSATNSTSESLAATPKAVKAAYELATFCP
ncbi:phage tail protein [Escherichia coli]|nr:phage tail protein [Escherichia coli]